MMPSASPLHTCNNVLEKTAPHQPLDPRSLRATTMQRWPHFCSRARRHTRTHLMSALMIRAAHAAGAHLRPQQQVQVRAHVAPVGGVVLKHAAVDAHGRRSHGAAAAVPPHLHTSAPSMIGHASPCTHRPQGRPQAGLCGRAG